MVTVKKLNHARYTKQHEKMMPLREFSCFFVVKSFSVSYVELTLINVSSM
jgi:hypothetical protein